MKRLYWALVSYTAAGLAFGLFYREFTKQNDFTATSGFTQLAVVHTHLLTLGTVVMLIMLALQKLFTLSAQSKKFSWFFWLYNAGLVLTTAIMVIHGMLQVLGRDGGSSAIAGMAGLGHMLLTAALAVLLVMLHRAIVGTADPAAASAGRETVTVGAAG